MPDFQITGWGFITLILVLTGVAFLGGTVLIPRLRTAGPGKYLLQALTLVLTSVLVLASVGVLMNRANHWYTNWDELFSGPPSVADARHQVYGRELPDHVQPAAVETAAHAATALQQNPSTIPELAGRLNPHASTGQYVEFPLPGSVSGQQYQVMVWLPASYLKEPQRFYPVIIGFTGFPGSTDTYRRSIDYGRMIEQSAQQGSMREAIFVVPEVFPGNYDSECVDATQNQQGQTSPKAETYVTQDLVPWLRENLRIFDDAAAWATEGYSAGGWCSAMMPLRHPQLFGSGMSQSGYFDPQYTDGQQWNPPHETRYHLAQIAAQHPPRVNLHVFTSSDDEISWPSTQKFLNAVKPPLSVTAEVLPSGGHRLDVWQPGMQEGLAWLGRTSPYFTPSAPVSPRT